MSPGSKRFRNRRRDRCFYPASSGWPRWTKRNFAAFSAAVPSSAPSGAVSFATLALLLAMQSSTLEHPPIRESANCCEAFPPRQTQSSRNLPFGRSPASNEMHERSPAAFNLVAWQADYPHRRYGGIIPTHSDPRERFAGGCHQSPQVYRWQWHRWRRTNWNRRCRARPVAR